MSDKFTSRGVEQWVRGASVSDGAGVRLLRVLSGSLQRRLDPFLMLDEFGSDNPDDYIAGFPDHPHRGFETVTYMLAGRMRHRDNAGHEGLLSSGGMQWMTAGRGIVHSELPEQQDGVMQGFQLWVNLPAARKMAEPDYRDYGADEIPVHRDADGATVKVIAGYWRGRPGAVPANATEVLYLDIDLPAACRHREAIPAGHNAFLYVYQGELAVGEGQEKVAERQMAVLSGGGDGVALESGSGGARTLLIAGRPLGEPIAQWGPFVMNTREEIEQAIADYRDGRF
ncbi:MAG: pirin family protein [Burkholderiales bacterium]|nr:pirin family protein [Sulfuricellaceae bacterium]